mgnify:CR=1 FL=1
MAGSADKADVIEVDVDRSLLTGGRHHEPCLEARQVELVQGDAVTLPFVCQDDTLDAGLARIRMRLVRPEQAHTDVEALATVFSPGPQFELPRAGEVMATGHVAPVVGRVLPGDADPGADLSRITQLDTRPALVGVVGMLAVKGQQVGRAMRAHPSGRHPGHALETVMVDIKRHGRAHLAFYQQRHIGSRRIARRIPGVEEQSIRPGLFGHCLLYTSDAADEVSPV